MSLASRRSSLLPPLEVPTSLRRVVAALGAFVLLGGVSAFLAVLLDRSDSVDVVVSAMYFAITTTILIGMSREIVRRASRACWLVLLFMLVQKISMNGPGNDSRLAVVFHLVALVLLLAPVTTRAVWTARVDRGSEIDALSQELRKRADAARQLGSSTPSASSTPVGEPSSESGPGIPRNL